MANWFSKLASSGDDPAEQGAPEKNGTEAGENPAPVDAQADDGAQAPADGELVVQHEADEAEQSRSLALLSKAQRAIAQAHSLDELKEIRDKAEAARKYAQAAGLGLEIQNYAAEVKLRAERRAGEFLGKLKLHGGDRRVESADARIKLDDIGVSKDQSSRWQLAAMVPSKEFERYVRETREAKGEVTTAGLIRIAREIRAKRRKSETEANGEATEEAALAGETTTLAALLEEHRLFGCIYAAPPWGTEGVSVEALAALPIARLSDGQTHLHLWTSHRYLFEAKQVLEHWGFEYQGLFVWVKPSGTETDYWLDSHELLLLGLRGVQPFLDRTLLGWLRCEAEASGEKPERFRQLIERVSPEPLLELFSDKVKPAWTTVAAPLDFVPPPDPGPAPPETP